MGPRLLFAETYEDADAPPMGVCTGTKFNQRKNLLRRLEAEPACKLLE